MNVTLKPELEQFIADEVRAGHFASPQEVIESAVARLMMDEQDASPDETAELKALLAVGLEQSARGESEDWDIDELRAEGQRLLKESRKKAI